MKKDKNEIQVSDDTNLIELVDKLLILQQGNKSPSFLKKVVYVVVGICCIMVVGLICVCIYKNNFTIESILSTLLAFFSIFISIFFFFKADETSTKFHDSSYKFMKDVSVTLGKIEERFGEKLNSINDKISHLERIEQETSAEIEDKQEDKDRMIDELIKKANLSAEESESYKRKLEKRDEEIKVLSEYKYNAEREVERLRRRMLKSAYNRWENSSLEDRNNMLEQVNDEEILKRLSVKSYNELVRGGYIDGKGKLNKKKILLDMEKESVG